jgi:RNA polymerase sigma-70 factor (ECF subfamily)
MARLAAGHDAALDDLMDRHGEQLFHYLLRALQNEDDAADLAQETFVRLYQSRAKFNPRQKFSSWLYTIATNLCRDRMRWRARHPQVSLHAQTPGDGPSLGDTLPSPTRSPSEQLAATERIETVRRAVQSLPEDLRLPLILAEYENQSYTEIAAVLKCTAKAVEMRLYRARQQLRSALAGLMAST